MMTRRALTLLLAVGVLLAVSASALAYWTAGGSGRGAASTGTLAAPAVSVPAKSGRSVAVHWDAQAPLSECADSVPADGTYTYRVVGVYRSWTAISAARSVEVVPAPSAPELAAAEATSPPAGRRTGAVALSWNAVPGAEGYAVYRAATSQVGVAEPRYTRLDAGAITGTTYADGELPDEGGTWHYAVKALGPGGASPFSNERSATAIARPAAPERLTVTAVAGGDIALAWDAVPGADGYRVYRRTPSGAYGDASPVAATEFRDPGAGLTDGERYVYMVRAVAGLESLDSAEAEARSDSRAPAYGASAVALSDDSGWINAASASNASVQVDLSGPGEAGDIVEVTLRDAAGAEVTRRTPVAAGIRAVTVGGIDASPLAEVSSSAADPAGARNLQVTATVADAAGNANRAATATATAGKDVTAPPASGPNGLVVTYSDGWLAGSGEPFDTIGAAREGGDGTVHAGGTVQADGSIAAFAVGALAPGETGVFHRVTETDPAGNALTLPFGPFAG